MDCPVFMLNTTASDCFRNALYAAAREQTIRFRDIGDLDETYCKEEEVLYDGYKLYLSLDLVKRLVAKRMPEFLTSDVLAQLTKAGILSSSTYASLCDRAGVNKDILKRAVGHTPKSKTLDEVYLHPKATQMIEAFDKANQLVNDEVLTTTKA